MLFEKHRCIIIYWTVARRIIKANLLWVCSEKSLQFYVGTFYFFVTIQLHVLFLHHVHITMILILELWNLILCCCTSTIITFVKLCVLISIIFCDSLFGLIYHWIFCITGSFISLDVCSYWQLSIRFVLFA